MEVCHSGSERLNGSEHQEVRSWGHFGIGDCGRKEVLSNTHPTQNHAFIVLILLVICERIKELVYVQTSGKG